MGRRKQDYVRYLLKPLCGILYFWMFGIFLDIVKAILMKVEIVALYMKRERIEQK